jgi:ABC-type lipoprotein release transport system permease subunit
VRLALGATGERVVRQIVRESMRVIAIGAVSGLALAFVVAIHVVQGGTVNLAIFIAVGALLMAVATVACWVPARRASRVDPVVALRVAE